MFHIFFVNGICKTQNLKSSLRACFLLNVQLKFITIAQIFMTWKTVFHKWGQKHRLPDTCVNNDYVSVTYYEDYI